MKSLIKLEKGTLSSETIDLIAAVESEAVAMVARRDDLRQALKEVMEVHGIKKVENEFFTLTFVEAGDREHFDKKQFREDMPEVYDGYVTMTPVASSIRVKLNKERLKEERDQR